MRVVFTPSGLSGTVATGTTVLDAARLLGADIDSVCGGRGVCGHCQVAPTAGSFPKWGVTCGDDSLSPVGPTELAYDGRRPLAAGCRLGCAAVLCGDAVVDVPAESQVHRQVVRKSVDVTGLVVDPLVALAYVELPAAALGDARSVGGTLLDALRDQHDVAVDHVAIEVLPRLLDTVARAGLQPITLREALSISGGLN